MAEISVLVVDDHAVLRQGLITFLSVQENIEVLGEAENGLEAVHQFRLLGPDVVLMDLMMPEMDGIEATRRIVQIDAKVKVIVLSSFTDDAKVFSAIEAGAKGYLLKDVSPSDLVKAILAVHKGHPIE